MEVAHFRADYIHPESQNGAGGRSPRGRGDVAPGADRGRWVTLGRRTVGRWEACSGARRCGTVSCGRTVGKARVCAYTWPVRRIGARITWVSAYRCTGDPWPCAVVCVARGM